MGWLSMQSLGGHAGPREYLDNQFAHEDDQLLSRVLRSSILPPCLLRAVETCAPARRRT